eukprot:CFRG1303T1
MAIMHSPSVIMDPIEEFQKAPKRWKAILALDGVVLLTLIIIMATIGKDYDTLAFWVSSGVVLFVCGMLPIGYYISRKQRRQQRDSTVDFQSEMICNRVRAECANFP